jgi:hypothetical protein
MKWRSTNRSELGLPWVDSLAIWLWIKDSSPNHKVIPVVRWTR